MGLELNSNYGILLDKNDLGEYDAVQVRNAASYCNM